MPTTTTNGHSEAREGPLAFKRSPKDEQVLAFELAILECRKDTGNEKNWENAAKIFQVWKPYSSKFQLFNGVLCRPCPK